MLATEYHQSIPARVRGTRQRLPAPLVFALIASLILSGILAAFAPAPADAAGQQLAALAFAVDSTADLPDFDAGDNACDTNAPPVAAGDCTLRAAIQQANAQASGNTFTITLAAGATYVLNVDGTIGPNEDDAATGDLDIKADVTIVGNGATINGNGDALELSQWDRVFHVFAGFTVAIDDVTIVDGYASQSNGGGILNDGGQGTGGSLTVSDSTLEDNATGTNGGTPLGGGAIFNGIGRTLTLANVTVSANSSDNGGGLYNFGTATVTGSTFLGNGAAGGGSIGPLPFGGGGGGGILNNGVLTIADSTITGNSSVIGGGFYNGPLFDDGIGTEAVGDIVATLTNTVISNNNAYFLGGGIATGEATLEMTGGSINANTASGFFFVFIPIGAFNLGGVGGGLINVGDATLTGVTVNGNSAAAFGTGEFSGGFAGGIGNVGTLTFDRGTISNNFVSGPGQGGGLLNGISEILVTRATAAGQPAGPQVAAIDTVATVTNSTISGNSALDSGGVLNDDNSTTNLVHVTAVSNAVNLANATDESNLDGVLTVQNSIVANSTAGTNCTGTITDNGYNVEDGPTCGFTATGSVANIDPLLGPLQMNAPGATATHALLAESPAIDRVPTSGAGCLPVDQRGVDRPVGAACDSGAYEADEVGFLVTVTTVGNGSVTPGTDTYPAGSTQSFTATAADDNLFLGWYVDDQFVGFSNPLDLPVTGARTVRAEFAETPTFCDTDESTVFYPAIVNLAARGVIVGKVNPSGPPTCFDADGTANRAEAAAFVARTFGWDDETHPNPFTDRCDATGCVGDELWNDIAALVHHGVMEGYEAEDCVAKGKTAPCVGPFDLVSRVQMISLVTRAFDTYDGPKPDWNTITTDDSSIYFPDVPADSPHRLDVVTYAKNVGVIPETPSTASWPDDPVTGQHAPASRDFVAEALWRAYTFYFGTNRVP